jgi:hypothetical protein
MTPSENEITSNLGAVFEKLVDLVHEVKQATWFASDSDLRHQLEGLQAYLAEQAMSVDEEEQQAGGRPSWIVSPTGYKAPNLSAEAGGDPGRFVVVLVEHLRLVIDDMRERSKLLPVEWGDQLSTMADNIERRVETLIR